MWQTSLANCTTAGEGGDDFIRPRIAQALVRLGDVFGRAPKADGDFQIRKSRSQF
jgi:hypothetical protein